MSWIRRLFARRDANSARAIDAEAFVFVVIRDSLGPIARGDAYEDELDAALQARGLGKITGGGSQLGDEQPDGTRAVEWCGIDVDVATASRRDEALALLRSELQRLRAPAGSELHYTESGARRLDRLDTGGWRLRLPRTDVHPYFNW